MSRFAIRISIIAAIVVGYFAVSCAPDDPSSNSASSPNPALTSSAPKAFTKTDTDSSNPATSPNPEPTLQVNQDGVRPAIQVMATEIPRAYIDNAIAADDRFKGHLLRVTGTIRGITTDVSGVPVIKLEDGLSEHPILCMFGTADINRIGAMHSGRSVSVTGAFERIDQDLYLNGCSLGSD